MEKIKYAGEVYEVISEEENDLTLRSVRDKTLIIKAKKDSARIEKVVEEKK